MMEQHSEALATHNSQPEARRPLLGRIVGATAPAVLTLLTLLPTAGLIAGPTSDTVQQIPEVKFTPPILVLIEDKAKGPPEVQVIGAPHGWNYCTDTCSDDLGYTTPGTDLGGIVSLFGVDVNGSINEPEECDWRFLDPTISQPACESAEAIVWIQHDYSYYGPFFDGELQVAFNIHVPGGYYANPLVCPNGACHAGVQTIDYEWQLVFSDRTLVVLFKAQKPD